MDNLRFVKNAAETGDFSKYWIPVMAVFIVHNIGEVAGNMPKWGQEHFAFLQRVGNLQFEFSIAVTILILVLIAIAFAFRNNHKTTRLLMIIFTVFMIGNCIWHTCTSLVAWSPSPGLLEALILGLPVYSYTLYRIILYEKMSRDKA
jgi:cytochrome c biogenesis protein CcdA